MKIHRYDGCRLSYYELWKVHPWKWYRVKMIVSDFRGDLKNLIFILRMTLHSFWWHLKLCFLRGWNGIPIESEDEVLAITRAQEMIPWMDMQDRRIFIMGFREGKGTASPYKSRRLVIGNDE